MTQLVQNFHSNSMQILIISVHDYSLNQSTYSLTNNCSNRYQLPNNDLASLPTNQAALYALQMTQLVQNFHSNSMQILSLYNCA